MPERLAHTLGAMSRRAEDPGGPFLKWAGGKARLVPFLREHGLFPARFGTYHEPFLGAGAVFFHLAEQGDRLEQAELSDANADLILAYRAVKEQTEELIEELKRLRRKHDEAHYYAARQRFNRRKRLSDVERAALLIYLNKTGFNGLYRVNASGEFNVPFGRYDDPKIFTAENLRSAACQLKRAQSIEVRDFASVLERARAGDFVYFDPPYVPLSRSAYFTSYTKAGFGEREQRRLAEVFQELASRGVSVMLSNHDTPIVRELYAGYAGTTHRLQLKRFINAKIARRSTKVDELVILSYPAAG